MIKLTAYGLTDEQARLHADREPAERRRTDQARRPPIERGWIDIVLQRDRGATQDDYETELPPRARRDARGRVSRSTTRSPRETEAVIAGIPDLGQAVPVPQGVPWYPDDVDAWSVRWVLLHLIAETARHAGHADIVRESIDGATAFPLMAAAEGWPATPWMQPWERA